MVLRKKTAKSAGKRRYKRYRRRVKRLVSGGTRGTSMRPNAMTAFDPLPYKMRGSFRYVNNGTMSTGSLGLTALQPFRMNSPYGPVYPSGGSSAQQWGLAISNYSDYQVMSCKVRIDFNDPSIDGLVVGVHAVQSGNDPFTSGTGLNDVLASQNTKWKFLNNSGKQTVSFRMTYKPYEWCTSSKIKYLCDDNYSAQTNASPANDLAYFQIFCLNQNLSNGTINFTTTIDYDTVLWGRKI